MDREQLAKEIFITDNGRLPRDVAEKEWAEAGFNQQNYAYKIADGLAPLIAADAVEQAQATVEAYVEAYPEFREGWGTDPESTGARHIAFRTTRWLRARTMTMYIVQRGNKPWAGISIITESKEYADGYAAGLNHCSKKYWHRVEEVEPLPAGTLVTYWLGEREGEGQPGTISGPLKLIGGTPRQNIMRSGPIPISHIEPLKEAA